MIANTTENGQVTGLLWNTQGDDAQRRYNYTYDNAGRLTNAAFTEKQHTTDAWSSSLMDFSINGTSGKITYDLNGNLLNMLHKGVLPGTATPITVDNLTYTYASYSNKLQSVTDGMTNTTVNGKFGDFKDGANGSSPDYVYDNNGNLVIDLNKNAKDLAGVPGANGIKYNYLDKPEEIRIAGKGTIKIVYSADGEKLQRKFTSETEDLVKITTYINQYIYEESTTIAGTVISPLAVGAINFEEGRIRVITPTSQGNGFDALIVSGNITLPIPPSGGGGAGVFDYYIMDYQQNVRMILTEEIHTASNTATLELDRATLEESLFGQTGANNEVATTRYNTPAAWTGNGTAKVSRLGTNAGYNAGPNTLQKVMAGDKITATVQYYHGGVAGGYNSNFLSTIVNSLTSAISTGSAAATLVKENAGNITTQLSGVNGFITAVQPNGSAPPGTAPQAWLTIIFFDERFNFIPAADGGVAQQQVAATVGSGGSSLTLTNIKAPKNGYAYVYISNQSNNDVYFDGLQVQVAAGNIIEENHYYAYGLKIATLSSKKLGDSYEGQLKNNYLYQGSYSELDDDIGWHDFYLRNYDAQIGRWVQQDPYQQFASPYVGMGGDPINLIDPSGGFSLPGGGGLSTTAEKAITLGEVVVVASRASKAVAPTISLLSKANIALNTAFKAANIINNSITATQAGDLHFTPGGKQMYFPDDNPEFFDGSVYESGGKDIRPMKGSVKSFIVRGESVDNGAARFVAMFKDGQFTEYAWDKKLSYSYNDFLEAATKDFLDELKHADDPTYQHYDSPEEARKAFISTNTGVAIPNPLLKYTTRLAIIGLKLQKSVSKVLGKAYQAMGEVTAVIKNKELLKKLNMASKGDWVKVYEAGKLNGKKVEVHYFRNNTTGEVFDVKIKYDYWHQKPFKKLE